MNLTGCDLIGRIIDYLNTNIFKEKKKNLAFEKNVNNKRKSVWHEMYILFLFYILLINFFFLTNDKPVIKIV